MVAELPLSMILPILGGIIIACLSYLFNKWKERESEWRKEKLHHYKAYISSLSHIMEGQYTEESQERHNIAFNDLNLFAPENVLSALQKYDQEISEKNPSRSRENHDLLLSRLILEMRKDLKVTPQDKEENFKVYLRAPKKNS